MRIRFLFLLAAAMLAGCDNNTQDSDSPDAKAGTTSQQSDNAPGNTGELVRILHTLEKTDEQCQGDGCPKVNLAWITFENQPTLNEAITTQLAGMLVQNQGSTPHDGTIESLVDAFLADASDMAMASKQGWELNATIKRTWPASKRWDWMICWNPANNRLSGSWPVTSTSNGWTRKSWIRPFATAGPSIPPTMSTSARAAWCCTTTSTTSPPMPWGNRN